MDMFGDESRGSIVKAENEDSPYSHEGHRPTSERNALVRDNAPRPLTLRTLSPPYMIVWTASLW